jgi:phosphoenolpyruvate carboxykinase (ATP)
LNEFIAILCFSEQTIIIGGTGYTGEIKKGIFSALNFILPTAHATLPMHCSANVGDEGDCALFFGLSGTGKTTLSADPNRNLIGDDEHGWTADGEVFNFEGGCYAKVIDLSESKEPDIWNAIKPCAILENIVMDADGKPNYADASITQNTRVSYPIHHIDRIAPGGTGPSPKNIFFLTADAYGVLPPISKLTEAQAAYHFISGYTAKVAGTEEGITEPVAAFSACFGAPFMPLHPGAYAEMLMEKSQDVNVWLINTGWVGGAYGTGSRIKLKYTRAMIQAALTGELDDAETIQDKVFGLHRIASCPNVPDHILNPRDSWANVAAYDIQADMLAGKFNANFKAYEAGCSDDILSGSPLKA